MFSRKITLKKKKNKNKNGNYRKKSGIMPFFFLNYEYVSISNSE